MSSGLEETIILQQVFLALTDIKSVICSIAYLAMHCFEVEHRFTVDGV